MHNDAIFSSGRSDATDDEDESQQLPSNRVVIEEAQPSEIQSRVNLGPPLFTQPRHSDIGNSTRTCGGRCIVPKGASMTLWLVFATLLPVVVFLTSVVPSTEWFSFTIVLILTCGAFIMQMFAVTCDPGIIPAAPKGQAPIQPKEIVLADGTKVLEKICPTCNIVRPPRSGHCSHCNNCVEDFDHHCGVVGSCVGRRTFRFFTFYFYFMTPLALYMWVRSLVALVFADWKGWPEGTNWERWQLVAALGTMIYTSCPGICVAGQGIWYTQLSCQNSTQKIQFQQSQGTVYAQQDQHQIGRWSCGAFVSRLCGPIPKSRVIDVEL